MFSLVDIPRCFDDMDEHIDVPRGNFIPSDTHDDDDVHFRGSSDIGLIFPLYSPISPYLALVINWRLPCRDKVSEDLSLHITFFPSAGFHSLC